MREYLIRAETEPGKILEDKVSALNVPAAIGAFMLKLGLSVEGNSNYPFSFTIIPYKFRAENIK